MNKKFIATFVFVGFVVIPLTINVIGTKITMKSNANFGDWLGFWGSYLGGFVTLVGVYLAFKLEEKSRAKELLHKNRLQVEEVQMICIGIRNRMDSNYNLISLLRTDFEKLLENTRESRLPLHLHNQVEKVIKNIAFILGATDTIDSYNELTQSGDIPTSKLDEFVDIERQKREISKNLIELKENVDSVLGYIEKHEFD